MLRDDLGGGLREEAREVQEGGDICIPWLIHFVVW